MHNTITIRPYSPADRSAVRQICGDTADAGNPLENFFADRELVADLVTRYYTDYESGYSWVAELNGQVAGYLTAAPDTRAFRRAENWSIGPQAFIEALGRGTLWTRSTGAMVLALIRQKGQAIRPTFHPPPAYPAHLHINLMKPARGLGIGERLIAELTGKLRIHQIPGVHATVRTDNPGACAFFERLDFTPVFHYSELLPARKGVQHVRVTVYGKVIL